MRNSAVVLLEYLILKVLASKEEVVRALYDYFVEGASPSSIALKYGLSKHQVRGYVQRIMEKAGSLARARVFMKHATPLIVRLRPVAKRVNGSMVVCSLCGEELPVQVMEDHIRKRHPEVVAECLSSVLEVLKKNTVKSGL